MSKCKQTKNKSNCKQNKSKKNYKQTKDLVNALSLVHLAARVFTW